MGGVGGGGGGGMAVSFYWWRVQEYPQKNHRSVASHWQTLSHNGVSSTTRMSGIRTQNVSGDRH